MMYGRSGSCSSNLLKNSNGTGKSRRCHDEFSFAGMGTFGNVAGRVASNRDESNGYM